MPSDTKLASADAIRDSIRLKSAELLERQRHTDHNGRYRPPTTQQPDQPATDA